MGLDVIIVDDDLPAIEELEDALTEVGFVGRIRTFSRSGEAFHAIREMPPDIVFLDIQMPGLTGLQIGQELRRVGSTCALVFVTAYEHHAIDAFELEAVDYLLKPVDPERLKKTLYRIGKGKGEDGRQSAFKPDIRCFGALRVSGKVGNVKWRTTKGSELFAYLYMHSEVAPERIIDDVFSNVGSEDARPYLHTCIYQLRKSLSAAGLSHQLRISYGQHRYLMETDHLSCDYQRFEWLTSRPDAGQEALLEAVSLYEGELLEGISNLWVLERRENCRRHFIRIAQQLIAELETSGDLRRAMEVAQKLHRHEFLDEEMALHVIRLYLRLHQYPLAEDYLKRFLERYKEELGVANDAAVEGYKHLLGKWK